MAAPAGEVVRRLVPLAGIDVAATAALINEAFSVYPILREERTSPDGVREECGADGEFFLAEREGMLVACAMVRPAQSLYTASNPFAIDLAGALYFGLAAVSRREMRSGLGKQLVAAAEALAAARGYRHVALTTVREFGLVEYYARLGYVAMHVDRYEAGHWGIVVPHCHYAMVKAL